jgi:hypothetical protein
MEQCGAKQCITCPILLSQRCALQSMFELGDRLAAVLLVAPLPEKCLNVVD